MRAFIYKWHRRLSIIIAIPVLLWAVSGFMHPLMTNIRPAIAAQQLSPKPIDSSRIHISLDKALQQHHIDSIAGFRIIQIDTNYFYQVQPAWTAANAKGPSSGVPVYLSCLNGNTLTAGDWLYAQYLARQFLEGQKDVPQKGSSVKIPAVSPQSVASAAAAAPSQSAHDCCGAAADFVLNKAKGAPISNVSLLNVFDPEYKSINRLLPVYRVSFQRSDEIRIYVETTQDRFSFAMDKERAVFDNIFRLFHTYGWLEWMGKGRLAVECIFALLALAVTLMGIYIFCVTKTKAPKGNPTQKTRRNHRIVSIIAALFTVMWTFSGAYHAFAKFKDDTRNQYFARDNFAGSQLKPDWASLQASKEIAGSKITNVSVIKIDTVVYYRVTTQQNPGVSGQNHKVYLTAASYRPLAQGDANYAASLAIRFSGRKASDIDSISEIKAFGDEYNFSDKRLPVWKVAFSGPDQDRIYIETSTGRLASRVNASNLKEGWSFSVLHKHHFMDWGGKPARDASTMFWTFAQLLMVAIGITLYLKTKKRARRQ